MSKPKISPDSKKQLGARLRYAREVIKDATQEVVAAHFGVSEQAVSQWEVGRGPHRSRLPLLAEFYGASLTWLMTGTGSPTEERTDSVIAPKRKEVAKCQG